MERDVGRTPEARGPEGTSGSPPPYEPPAIAWEEAFEPLAATSCGLTPGFEQQCTIRPTT